MMNRVRSLIAMLAMAAGAALAASPADVDAKGAEGNIRNALEASRPDLKVTSVEPAPVAGLFAVQFENGPVVYATADGRHFVLGDLFRVESDGFVNLAEAKRDERRAELLGEVTGDDIIAFKPQGKSKAVVHVFTDVDCFYCQLLHQHMAEYNKLGIEVRYLAYPRAGLGSESYQKIATAWCADDRQAALTRLKSRQAVAIDVCETNPVAAQFALGNRMGVEGTPAIITESGKLLPGFLPPEQLAQALGLTP